MKEVIVLASCDMCLATSEDLKSPSDHTVIASFGSAPKEIDLCDEHYEFLVAPLTRLLATYGVEPGKIPKRMQATPQVGKKAAAVMAATAPRSDSSLVELDSEGRVRCPSCGNHYGQRTFVKHLENTERIQIPRVTECPDCGYAAERSQEMSQHRSKRHGWNPIENALQILADTLASKPAQIPLAG